MRRRAPLALALALIFAPALAEAQAPDARARSTELKRQGDQAMDAHRFADAAATYERALEAYPEPSLYYNLGRAYQELERYAEALTWMRRFEHEAPEPLKARVRKLSELIADLRARVAEVSVRVNVDGARVSVRDRPVGVTPLPGPLALEAGQAAVDVSADGYQPHRGAYDLAAGSSLVVDIQLTRVGAPMRPYAPPPPPPKAEGAPTRWWLWAGVGVAVVAAGVVTYVALTTERSPDRGDFGGTGRYTTPLLRF
jgi:Tetratricopeptide repeat/PEGA domain